MSSHQSGMLAFFWISHYCICIGVLTYIIIMSLALISLTLSCHFSLSFIASGRSSGLHPVSSHSCCMYVLASHPALARPYVGVHRSTSLMSLTLLFQQCPACLVGLTWNLILLSWSEILKLSTCVDPMYISLHLLQTMT